MTDHPNLAAALVAALADLTVIEKGHTANAGSYCIDPATPVLTADLHWIAAGDLLPGDLLVGFDEDPPGPNRARRWRQSAVMAAAPVRLPSFRVTLVDGTEFVASSTHRWLVRSLGDKAARWVDTRMLRTTHQLLRVVRPWRYEPDWATGYLAAAFDGEGSLTQTGMTPRAGGGERHQCHLTFTQRDNCMLETVDKLGGAMGFVFGDYAKADTGVRTRRVSGGRGEVLRFLGTVRPERLLVKFDPDRLGDMRTVDEVHVAEVEPLGVCDLTAIRTSTSTFLANGFATHNSYDYADLADIVKLTRPVLAAHGVVVLQSIHSEGTGLAVTTNVLHASGECNYYGPLTFPYGRDAQATGSAITYHRRYALLAALGMATGDDDDGAKAVPAPVPSVPGFRQSLIDALAKLSEPEKEHLRAWAAEQGLPAVPARMDAAQAERVVEYILHGLPKVDA